MAFLKEYKKVNLEKLLMETGQYSVFLGVLGSYLGLSKSSKDIKTDVGSLARLVDEQSKKMRLPVEESVSSLAEILGVSLYDVFGYMTNNIDLTEKKINETLEDIQNLRDFTLKLRSREMDKK